MNSLDHSRTMPALNAARLRSLLGAALVAPLTFPRISARVQTDWIARPGHGDEDRYEGILSSDPGTFRTRCATRELEFLLEIRPVTISASIGIAHYAGDDLKPDAFIKNAHSALYRAKEQRRDRYAMEVAHE